MMRAGWVSMTAVGSNTDDTASDQARAPEEPPRPAGRLLRVIGWATAAVCTGAPVTLALGFLCFVWWLPEDEIALTRNADGIVVLTGGASRISDAIELLANRRGQRLLISGANRSTNLEEISRLNPEFARWVRCCVDVDRSLNTLGNAIEIRRWTERRGFRSLIVVTSHYHMPRAMAEIAHQLPQATLIPFPVISGRLRAEPWYENGATMRLLLSEYLKYIVAQMRIRLHPSHGIEPA
jgi:uncharacterized SAM-binding protein YcdF (DUF218 family)